MLKMTFLGDGVGDGAEGVDVLVQPHEAGGERADREGNGDGDGRGGDPRHRGGDA
jgi:hypothetical protein